MSTVEKQEVIQFKCGCRFDKKNPLSFSKVHFNCQATWDLISNGLTKGVFQLEKVLGRRWAKKVKPRNMDELSDLLSLIRPGPLDAEYREKDDDPGKFYSIAETYVRVKHGKLEPQYDHPVLEKILSGTYGCLIYQEQIMFICTEFAGMTLKEADDLRRAVGKKKKELMAKMKDKFVQSAVRKGENDKMAEHIFEWISKFANYGFNKSHGVGYAYMAYRTAYAKCHFPLEFFKAMLTNSEGKQDELEEIKQLVNEAKLWNIKVKTPQLSLMNKDFIMKDGAIIFGLLHIKGVGASAFNGLKKISSVADYKELLKKIFIEETKVDARTMEALIKSGAIDYLYDGGRIGLLKLYRFLKALTEREVKYVFEQVDKGLNFGQAISELLKSDIPNKSRKPRIEQNIADIKAEFATANEKKFCIAYEKYHLGMALSGSETELFSNPKVNMTCRSFLKIPDKTKCTVGVIVDKIKHNTDRNGGHMAFLEASDHTYMMDGVVVFASKFEQFKRFLEEEGRPLAITGRKDGESFLVDKIEDL